MTTYFNNYSVRIKLVLVFYSISLGTKLWPNLLMTFV